MVIKWPKPDKPSPEVELEIVGFGDLWITGLNSLYKNGYRTCTTGNPGCEVDFKTFTNAYMCDGCKKFTKYHYNHAYRDKKTKTEEDLYWLNYNRRKKRATKKAKEIEAVKKQKFGLMDYNPQVDEEAMGFPKKKTKD